MSSYEFVGEKILAKGFAGKNEKVFVRLQKTNEGKTLRIKLEIQS